MEVGKTMKKHTWIIFFVFTFVLLACMQSTSLAKSSAFPRTFVDDSGTKVTIRTAPSHIVSLYPSNTEIVYALGRGKAMVGRSAYCNYPAKALKLPSLGDYYKINAEQILALHTDLLLIHKSQYASFKSQIDVLKKQGVQVVVVGDANSFADAYADIQLIGKAIGASTQAESLIDSMKARLKKVEDKVKSIENPRKVYIEVDNYQGYWTTGSGTFMDEMLNIVHATNVAHQIVGWNALSSEQIIKYKPDAIVVTYASYDKNAIQHLKGRVGWSAIPAVRYNHVYSVNGDLVTRPGPRLIVGVEELAKKIYPNQFK
jgi:iron complex transport system substrate-binding protein